MDFTPGTDALIEATTLENQFYSLASLIQDLERNATINPEGNINIVTATYDSDTGIFSGSADIFAIATPLADGSHNITYPNPYTNYSSWTEGTGGQGMASNINHAIAQRGMWLAMYERMDLYNLTNADNKFTGWSWEYLDEPLTIPITHNCKLTFSFSLELELVSSSNGTQYRAKSYLTGILPNP